MYQVKAKNSAIKDYALCLGNVSKDFIINNMKKNRIKKSWGILKILIELLTGLVNGSNHTNSMLLSKKKCMTQPTLINYILMNTVKNFTTMHLRLN